MPYNSETGLYERRSTTVIDATPDGDTVAVAIDTKLDQATDDAVTDLNHHDANGNHYPDTTVTTTKQYLAKSPAGSVSWANGVPLDEAVESTLLAATDGSDMVGYGAGTVTDALDSHGADIALNAADIAAFSDDTGASLVGFIQSGTGAVGRTAQNKMREWVSVKDFDAKGDGVTDDGDAISNAIASGAGRVFFPAGSYLISTPISVPPGTNGLVLFGAGKGATHIVNTGTDAIQLVGTGSTDETGVFGVRIQDMTVEGDGSSGHGICLSLAYHCVIDNVECTGHGADGIRVRMGFYNEIRHCRSHGNTGNGLFIGRTGNANNVIGGHYRINGGAGIRIDAESTTDYPHGISLFAPTIEGNGTYGVHLNAANEVRVNGCYFETTSAFGTTAQVFIDGASKYCTVEDCNFTGDVLSINVNNAQDCGLSGNSINYGLTIGASAVRTVVEKNRRIDGTITDNSATTIMLYKETAANKYYIKQGTDKGYSLLVGGTATVEHFGANYSRFDFNALTSAFTFKVLDLGGTVTPILMLGGWRLFVGSGGKLYIKGGDPTTTSDGTVVGTQT